MADETKDPTQDPKAGPAAEELSDEALAAVDGGTREEFNTLPIDLLFEQWKHTRGNG